MLDKNSPFHQPLMPKREESRLSLALAVLGDAIIECSLRPGSLVSEAEFDQRFSLGLASVRGALARLAATGHVLAEGRKGWRILPVSTEHLCDLQLARSCLEPVLATQIPPAPLRTELRQRAAIHRGLARGSVGRTLFHQERNMLALCCRVIAAPRLRGWLGDSWDLSMRADRFLDLEFGVDRSPLPLADLAEALAQAEPGPVLSLLEGMRTEFATRCNRALARSDAQIAPPAAAPARTSRPDARPVGRTAMMTHDSQQGEPT